MTASNAKTPLVSIIVPNYNHAPFLQQRIESILAQTYQNFELILLDDCSTDDSINILNTYKEHSKVCYTEWNTTNSGSTFKQWAKGIDHANGTYIWIAESDDFSEPSFLSTVMDRFASNPKIDIVFTGITNVIEDGSIMHFIPKTNRLKGKLLSSEFTRTGHSLLPEFLPDICLIRNVSCSVFKKNIAHKHIPKISNFKLIGDFYFWIVLCMNNSIFSYVNQPLNYMRNHLNSVRSSKTKDSLKSEFRKIYCTIALRYFYNYKLMMTIIRHYRSL